MFGYYSLDKSAACILLKVAAIDGKIDESEFRFIANIFKDKSLYGRSFYEEAMLMDIEEAMKIIGALDNSSKLKLAMTMIAVSQADQHLHPKETVLITTILAKLEVLELLDEIISYNEKLRRMGLL